MPDHPELETLHQRYQKQAQWTKTIREHLLDDIVLPPNAHILEVGCGTGVILNEDIPNDENHHRFGIDIEKEVLRFAYQDHQENGYAQADALTLPFPPSTFDLVFCHFFLLWARPVVPILREIQRVLKTSAFFLAFAEPDYGGRIDAPVELAQLGKMQEQALRQQGAETRIGRELAALFSNTNFIEIKTGVLGGEWQVTPMQEDEIQVIINDLHTAGIDLSTKIKELLRREKEARTAGTRILFVPTFYAAGKKKKSAAANHSCKNGQSAL